MSSSSTAWPAPFFAAAICVVACGSRTPLDVVPSDASDTHTPDATVDGRDAEVVSQCVTGSRAIGQIPIDLYFALDRSKSMDTMDRGSSKTRWESVSAAMKVFVNSSLSAGLGAGVAFFPRSTPTGGPYCQAADYVFPVVPIGALPGAAPSIERAISLQSRAQGTPTTPALDGAHVYLRRQQVTAPDHTAFVVVVTDGVPRDCGSTVTGTAAVAAAATVGSPPIKTYVLGVGPNLDNLNTIAQAGGTTQAYLVESGGEAGLLAALEAIRTSALACEFVIPAVGGNLPNLDVVRVATRMGPGGGPAPVDPVESAEACAGKPGWFYDNPIRAGGPPPTKILLCPESCAPLVQSTGNHLDVAIGCPTP